MKQFVTSHEAASSWNLEPATPSRQEAQAVSKNPVILALRCIDQSQPETEHHATDKFRIANEILQHIGWLKAEGATGSDGAVVRAFRQQGSKERVKQTRVELETYLMQSRDCEERRAHDGSRPATRQPHDASLRNPILAVLDQSPR